MIKHVYHCKVKCGLTFNTTNKKTVCTLFEFETMPRMDFSSDHNCIIFSQDEKTHDINRHTQMDTKIPKIHPQLCMPRCLKLRQAKIHLSNIHS